MRNFQITRLLAFSVVLATGGAAQAQLQDATQTVPRWETPGAGSLRVAPAETRVAIGTNRKPLGVLHINGEFDASLETGPSGTIHLSHGVHSLLLDSNEILARRIQSGTADFPKRIVGSALHLNAEGGGVFINAQLDADQRIGFRTDGSAEIGKALTIGGGNSLHNSADLSVAGSVVAREVVVTPHGWADDVFDTGYDLRSLDELREFIRDNRHLPGIPSATEVGERGVALGDFNRELLRNVEELTVRMIDQQQQHAKEKRDLEQRIESLEQLVGKLVSADRQ